MFLSNVCFPGTSSSGETCDWEITGNVTAHMQRVVGSAERSYTFVHLDHLDGNLMPLAFLSVLLILCVKPFTITFIHHIG